jgi:hypothetical protein
VFVTDSTFVPRLSEQIAVTQSAGTLTYNFTLNNPPTSQGLLIYTSSEKWVDDGSGNIVASGTLTSGTVDYVSGDVQLIFNNVANGKVVKALYYAGSSCPFKFYETGLFPSVTNGGSGRIFVANVTSVPDERVLLLPINESTTFTEKICARFGKLTIGCCDTETTINGTLKITDVCSFRSSLHLGCYDNPIHCRIPSGQIYIDVENDMLKPWSVLAFFPEARSDQNVFDSSNVEAYPLKYQWVRDGVIRLTLSNVVETSPYVDFVAQIVNPDASYTS